MGPSRYSPIAHGRKACSLRGGRADGAGPFGTKRRVWISEREEAWRPEEQGGAGGWGPDGWRNDTMGLGGGPQGSNLFPQTGRLTSSRSVDSEYAERSGVDFREGGSVKT